MDIVLRIRGIYAIALTRFFLDQGLAVALPSGPVEFYPHRVRYVDLEIDVVQFPDGRVEVVDEGELARGFEQGHLTVEMVQKAIDEASRLKKLLKSHCESPGPGPGDMAI